MMVFFSRKVFFQVTGHWNHKFGCFNPRYNLYAGEAACIDRGACEVGVQPLPCVIR